MPTGLNLWLDANDVLGTGTNPANGTIVTSWKDKSGLGNHGTGAGNPVLSNLVVNGQPGIGFNGTSQYFLGSNVNTTSNVSVFAVGTMDSGIGVNSRLVSLNSGKNGDFDRNTYLTITRQADTAALITYSATTASSTKSIAAYGTPFYAESIVSNTAYTLYVNGVAGTAGVRPTGAFGYTNYAVGVFDYSTGFTNHWKGYISEVLIYNSALSSYDRLRVETYLANKWSVAQLVVTPAGTFTTSTYNGRTFYRFTASSSSITVNQPCSVDILAIGGGGGGGYGISGGGGAGGMIQATGMVLQPGTHAITIGGGGLGSATNGVNAANGTNTSLGTFVVAIGGGGGGNSAGSSGGCGGGSDGGGGGVGTQGYDGGAGVANANGGGGGGVGGVGRTGTSARSGNGGDGIMYNIGSSVLQLGGGGGGAGYTNASGVFGGGNAAVAGTPNTGGGGGGGGTGLRGGTGVLIISFG
jgi:hypothetical protein